MNSFSLIFFCSVSLGFCTLEVRERPEAICESAPEVIDTYWREWKNVVPKDAVAVDEKEDEAGTLAPLYVGRTLYLFEGGSLQPVGMFSHTRYVEPTHGNRVYATRKNIEILCSRNQDITTWVPLTEINHIKIEDDCIKVGFEDGAPLYFGRTKFNNNTIHGKAKVYDDEWPDFLVRTREMHFPWLNREEKSRDFDVLCFNHAVEKRQREHYIRPEPDKRIESTTPRRILT